MKRAEHSEAVQPLKQKPHKLSHILSWSSWIYGLPLISNRRVWKGLKKLFSFFIISSLFPPIHNCFYYCMIARDSGNFYGTHVLFDFFCFLFLLFHFFSLQWRSFKFQLFFCRSVCRTKTFFLNSPSKKRRKKRE